MPLRGSNLSPPVPNSLEIRPSSSQLGRTATLAFVSDNLGNGHAVRTSSNQFQLRPGSWHPEDVALLRFNQLYII